MSNIKLSLRERVLGTEVAINLLNALPLGADGGDRILMLASLMAAERADRNGERVPIITLLDMLASYDMYMSRLLDAMYSDFWGVVAEMVNDQGEDEEGAEDANQ